jgi:hypothetical protein
MNSRFDKPFRQAQGPEPAEGLKALSLPRGIYRMEYVSRTASAGSILLTGSSLFPVGDYQEN